MPRPLREILAEIRVSVDQPGEVKFRLGGALPGSGILPVNRQQRIAVQLAEKTASAEANQDKRDRKRACDLITTHKARITRRCSGERRQAG